MSVIGFASATDSDMNGLIDEHEAITEYLGGMTCMGCHPNEATLMLQSTHYLWQSPVNGKGKANIQDTYCTNAAGTPQWGGIVRTPGPDGLMITGDDNAGVDGIPGTADDLDGPDGILGTDDDGLEVGGGCLMCHVGFGLMSFDNLGTGNWNDLTMIGLPEEINLDCLICHADTGYNRLPMFMGDEVNPTASAFLPGGPGYPLACFDRSLYLANPADPSMTWCKQAVSGSTQACIDGNGDGIPDEEMCFYDASPVFSFDDRLVMNDDRFIVTFPVAVGFIDEFFTLMGKPGLGKNIQGVGPRLTTADLMTNPDITPQASASLGGQQWPTNNQVAIDAARQVVGRPTDEACLRCHATSGGSSNAKRGDIGISNFDEVSNKHDMHLGSDIFDIGLKCIDCHIVPRDVFTHRITTFDMFGKGMDIATGGNRLDCLDCHPPITHEDLNPLLDTHTDKVACQTCHIPKVAKLDSTEIKREWMNEAVAPYGAPVTLVDPLGPMFGIMTHDSSHATSDGIWNPYITKQANLTPGNGIEYVWWNGDVDFIDEFETISLSSDNLVSNVPQGNIADGKIYPIKVQETQWFVDQSNNFTVPIDVGIVSQGWGIEAGLRFGGVKNGQMPMTYIMPYLMFDPVVNMICITDPMANGCMTPGDKIYAYGQAKGAIDMQMTMPLNVGVQRTRRFASLNHEVTVSENALVCDDCHGASPILDWVGLGYPGDPWDGTCQDNDGDGFEDIMCGGNDCDDSNPNVNPGESETFCDGINNDCDASTDDNPDDDFDGYGVCDGDCDDSNDTVNPGESEVCGNGIDDDCDGNTSDTPDNDGDGFSDFSCGGTDCDDNNPIINPGMSELCNGIDDDCDTQIDEECLLLETIYVDDDPGCLGNSPCFTTIQSAVNSGIEGSTIFVLPGTYIENVEISKSINLIGAGADVTFVNPTDPSYHIFLVTMDHVNISGFTISGANIFGASGILVIHPYSTISENLVTNNGNGIRVDYISGHSTISDNVVTGNRAGIGIYEQSDFNIIKNNIITENSWYGLRIASSNNQKVYNNYFNNNNNAEIDEYGTGPDIFLNSTKFLGTNVVGGHYLGGNFWAKPDGTGFSETCLDMDGDFICDSSFNFLFGNVDYLPLAPNTPTGSSIAVNLESGSLIFDSITDGGLTMILPIGGGNETSPPSNFQIIGHQYDIFTSAQFNGNIQVCLNYDDSGIADESTLKLMHYESSSWIDVTTSLVTTINKICGSVTSLSPFAVMEESPCAAPFSDIVGHWAYSYIEYLFCNGIVNGYPDGTFQPGNSITRGQFAKMIVNANGIPEYHPATPTFSDVPSDHWSYGYVEAAVQAGIISGYPDGTFRPASQVTRAQISAMIARSRGWTYSGGLEDFTDVPPSHWAYDNIMSMKEKGIIGGYPDGTFLPANQATRGQNSKMIANMMQTP